MSNKGQAEKKTIEETFTELEDIITKMDSGECSLEESFQFYETGMKLVKTCNDKIDKVEKKMIVLSEEGEEHDS